MGAEEQPMASQALRIERKRRPTSAQRQLRTHSTSTCRGVGRGLQLGPLTYSRKAVGCRARSVAPISSQTQWHVLTTGRAELPL